MDRTSYFDLLEGASKNKYYFNLLAKAGVDHSSGSQQSSFEKFCEIVYDANRLWNEPYKIEELVEIIREHLDHSLNVDKLNIQHLNKGLKTVFSIYEDVEKFIEIRNDFLKQYKDYDIHAVQTISEPEKHIGIFTLNLNQIYLNYDYSTIESVRQSANEIVDCLSEEKEQLGLDNVFVNTSARENNNILRIYVQSVNNEPYNLKIIENLMTSVLEIGKGAYREKIKEYTRDSIMFHKLNTEMPNSTQKTFKHKL